MYKQIEGWLVAKGFLSPTHTVREKFAGVWFACAIAASLLWLLITIIDIALLDRLLLPVLRP
jgi:hypothetical protein